MFINNEIKIIRRNSGEFVLCGETEKDTLRTFYPSTEKELCEQLDKVYEKIKSRNPSMRPTMTEEIDFLKSLLTEEIKTAIETATTDPKAILENTMKKFINFFTEFQFEPNFRFVNSFAFALAKSENKGKEYIKQYFELIDSPYSKEVSEKIKSAEFKEIIAAIKGVTPSTVINNRFKLYYGSQGTGKTTIAMEETEGRVMVCNSSMLPADLMEDFVFVDGKATFKPSALWRSMVEGTKIVLDELNLLPFDSLRFLQTILDGKKQFLYKGNLIEIAEGFQIIGTMNLVVNGMTYGLPEPLVDRCAETRKFSLSAKDLVSALM